MQGMVLLVYAVVIVLCNDLLGIMKVFYGDVTRYWIQEKLTWI